MGLRMWLTVSLSEGSGRGLLYIDITSEHFERRYCRSLVARWVAAVATNSVISSHSVHADLQRTVDKLLRHFLGFDGAMKVDDNRQVYDVWVIAGFVDAHMCCQEMHYIVPKLIISRRPEHHKVSYSCRRFPAHTFFKHCTEEWLF